MLARRALLLLLIAAAPACQDRVETSRGELPRRTLASPTTPLDEYVRRPDPSYAYRAVATLTGEGYVAHVLEMTSQTWRSPAEVDHTVWKHWLTIIVPEGVSGSTGMLYLTGGKNSDAAPDEVDSMRLALARATRSVVAELRMVPSQPLLFADQTEPRREDALIAYGWDRFLRSGDPLWLPRLPMTKSAVRAMDTITAFCASAAGGAIDVDRFVVAGRSKRGWTAWTTAAVDDRVVGVVPIVIDLLNLEESFRHHFEAFGFWSPAIGHYTSLGIQSWFGTPEMAALRAIVEPYSYRERLTLPKFIVNATGDPFFQPDSSRLYFSELPGEKFLRYVPNTGHELPASEVLSSVVAFYRAIVDRTPLPRLSWSFEPDGSIVVPPPTPAPSRARLWQASNAQARDFRNDTLGPVWTSRELSALDDGSYVARVESPAAGWTAYFVELTFPGGGEHPFTFTTDVRVIPDTLPHTLPPPRRSDPPASTR